jgi:glycosyltransferase involved in cell wall biosynthesis
MLAHRRAMARLRPDVVHCNLNDVADARWAVLIATTLRKTRVVAVEQLPLQPADRSVIAVKRLGSRRLHAHVAVGERAARAIEETIDLPVGSIRTIYNGVVDQGAAVRAEISGERPLVVGTLARLDPIKGLDLLVSAVARLERLRLLIVGEGALRTELLDQARRLGIQDRVELRPWDDEARRCLAELDVFVLPSRNEGFPLSIIEGMLAGLPVVATDVGSVAEAVVDGATGYVVAPDDIDALTAALEQLCADPELRGRFGAAGRARALERFTAQAMADAFAGLYREVLAG